MATQIATAQPTFEYPINNKTTIKRQPRAQTYSIEADIVTSFGSFFVLVNVDPIITSHGAFYDLHGAIIRDIRPLFNPDIFYLADLYIDAGVVIQSCCLVNAYLMERVGKTGCTMILTAQSQLAVTV